MKKNRFMSIIITILIAFSFASVIPVTVNAAAYEATIEFGKVYSHRGTSYGEVNYRLLASNFYGKITIRNNSTEDDLLVYIYPENNSTHYDIEEIRHDSTGTFTPYISYDEDQEAIVLRFRGSMNYDFVINKTSYSEAEQVSLPDYVPNIPAPGNSDNSNTKPDNSATNPWAAIGMRAPDPTPVSMYRVYNPNSGEHFYTSNQSEVNNLVALGWKNEGLAWKSPTFTYIPVYRLYNPNSGVHHYTITTGEVDNLVNAGWINEGVGWYSAGSGTDMKEMSHVMDVYRQYNPNSGQHNYTTSKAENDFLVKAGWKEEGAAFTSLQ